MKIRHISIFLLLVCIYSCVPESNSIQTDIRLDLTNPTVQRIIQHELDQNKDSLIHYAQSADPTHRYLVARAFSSIQSESVIPSLDSLLNDPLKEVSAMAAYALGQLESPKVEPILVRAFKPRDTTSVDNQANSNILEAIGKVGSRKMLDALSKVSTYRKSDTLLLLGQVRGFYEFASRGIVNNEASEMVVKYINDVSYPKSVRLMAANYLSRSKDVQIDNYKFQISQALIKETDPEIKMVLALSLRKVSDPDIQKLLLEQLELEQEGRIKINVIKALSNQDYIGGAEKMIQILSDNDLSIAQSAAEFFVNNGNKDDAVIYRNLARETNRPWSIRAKLYEATFKNLPYYYTKTINATRRDIFKLLDGVEDPYQRAGYIKALGNDPYAYEQVYGLIKDANSEVEKTTCMMVLKSILEHPEFELTFKTNSNAVRRTIVGYLNEVMLGNNVGMIAIAGDIIANEPSKLEPLIDNTSTIESCLNRLSLPKDIEAYQALEKALAHLKGVNNPVLTQAKSNFKPNFELLNKFKDEKIVIVKTTKGLFNLKLMPEKAPISVLNFLELIESKYYNDKAIHRVVPNFVVQIGCNRGDGYGSLDYSISSEVGPEHYDGAGYVGYASAGLHSESSQWFVTQSATPHLDGKYTIFAKVVEGMDVVNKIEIGDKILDVIVKQI